MTGHLYVEAKCPTLMKMGEEEYLKSNSKISNNRKVQVFSCRFDPWANWLPTTNWVSGCLMATAARHPFSSHRSPCRPSQFAPCTFLKHIRMFKRGKESIWENYNIPDPINPDFALNYITTASVLYKSWNRAVYLTLQSGYAWVDKASILHKWHGFCLTGGQPNTILTAMRNKTNRGHQHASDTSCNGAHACPLTLRNDNFPRNEGTHLVHQLPFSLRRMTLHSNRLMHKFTFRFLRSSDIKCCTTRFISFDRTFHWRQGVVVTACLLPPFATKLKYTTSWCVGEM